MAGPKYLDQFLLLFQVHYLGTGLVENAKHGFKIFCLKINIFELHFFYKLFSSFLKLLLFFLRGRHTGRSPTYRFLPPGLIMALVGAKANGGTQSRLPTWLSGVQCPELSLLPPSAHQQEVGVRNGSCCQIRAL